MVNATPCAIDGCDRPRRKRDWCDAHYWRIKNWGHPGDPIIERRPPLVRKTPLERIEQDARGCWLWTGGLDRKGYGKLRADGKTRSAHRYFYALLVGPIPEGLQIDHLCRVRNCVNPDHMEPVTLRENLARSTNAARFGILFDTCKQGHPFTDANTYRAPSRPNIRVCRTCAKEKHRRSRQARAGS